MKKISFYIILSLCLTQISCQEDFLKTTDPTRIGRDLFYQNQTQFEQALNGVYGQLQTITNSAYIQQEMMSDNTTFDFNPLDRGGAAGWEAFEYSTVNQGNGEISSLWNNHYSTMYNINYALEKLAASKIDATAKGILEGEFKFLRAYHYFNLVRYFGDVVLATKTLTNPNEAFDLVRSPQADVYKQIETDLLAAITVLPAVQTQKGRITKYAAQALLGKVYLYQNKFDAAAAMLDNVINSNAFTLVSDFGSMFLASGENGPESIFEIQYSNVSPYYNWGGATRGQGNYAIQQCGIRGLNGSAQMPYAAGWSTNLPSQNLAAAYAAGDKRKAVTVLDIEAYKTANPSFNITYQVAPYKNTGLYNQKYLPRVGQTSGQVELNYLNNFRIIRYADVLLMAAEAYNRATTPNDAKALGYLNQVRQRAFGNTSNNVTATGAALKQAIWDERRLELAMEGDRFFDLVRTGQAASKITGFRVGKHEVFPIPQQEVDISGLTQNAGY